MKVWITKGGWDYDGDTIIGVFGSENEARSEAEKEKDSFDYTDVKDYEVR